MDFDFISVTIFQFSFRFLFLCMKVQINQRMDKNPIANIKETNSKLPNLIFILIVINGYKTTILLKKIIDQYIYIYIGISWEEKLYFRKAVF